MEKVTAGSYPEKYTFPLTEYRRANVHVRAGQRDGLRARPVRDPADAVVDEEQLAVQHIDGAHRAAAVQHGDRMGVLRAAVRDEQFLALEIKIGEEHSFSVEGGDAEGVGGLSRRDGGIVAGQIGPRCGPIGKPDLIATGSVVGGEDHAAVESRQFAGVRARGPGRDVAHHLRSGDGSVGDPKLLARRRRRGGEEHLPAGDREVAQPRPPRSAWSGSTCSAIRN